MNRNYIMIGLILAALLGGGLLYRSAGLKSGGSGHTEAVRTAEKAGGHEGHTEETGGHGGHNEHGGTGHVAMSAELQRQNGVVLAAASRQRLGGTISTTGKIETNGDRIAHVSPRIPGKIVSVKASLGDAVSAGKVLATLDSVELGEALNRFQQSRTRLALAQSNMERVRGLVEKKIAPRKDILQAETDFKTAQSELHTDQERLSLFGVAVGDLRGEGHTKPLLPVRSPISGIITEKHAIVGELADPSKSLYTVADLSSVWVMVDINEKDLAKVRSGQSAIVSVAAFPEQKFRGRINHIADAVDQASRTVKARIEVANPGRRLKPEMFATAELVLPADTAPVLAVPEEALQEIDGKKVLFVADDGGDGFDPRRVEAGRTAGGLVEIVSGLKEGERYAVKGAFILKSELQKGEMKDEHGH